MGLWPVDGILTTFSWKRGDVDAFNMVIKYFFVI